MDYCLLLHECRYSSVMKDDLFVHVDYCCTTVVICRHAHQLLSPGVVLFYIRCAVLQYVAGESVLWYSSTYV